MSDVLALCYHAVSDSWDAPLAVAPGALERQLQVLLDRGYEPVTFHEAVHSRGAVRTLAVTFDDAYRSVCELALPVLSRLGIPATVFVPTRFAGSAGPMSWPGIAGWVGGPREGELAPMSWPELRRLTAEGWEIGSHTRTHPLLTELGDEELRDELEGSRRDCERELERPCRSLAYPFGDEDQRVIDAARAAGYSAAAALPSPLSHRPDPMRWPRVAVHGSDDEATFRRKVSPLRRRARASRWWRLVLARHALRSRLPGGSQS